MDEDIVPGGGFVYEEPVTIGPLSITCSHDYELQKDVVHSVLSRMGYDDEEIGYFDEDLGIDGDVDAAYGAMQRLQSADAWEEVVDIRDVVAKLQDVFVIAQNDTIEFEEQMSGMAELAERFRIDDHEPQRLRDDVKIIDYVPSCKESMHINHGLLPPRPGYVQERQGQMVALVLLADGSQDAYRLRSERKWQDVLGKHLPKGARLGPEEHYDRDAWTDWADTAQFSDATSTLASTLVDRRTEFRSNSRPSGRFVAAKMQDGSYINLGTHSYTLRSDVSFPVSMDQCDIALAELFAATAGEGLACATGSHSLHQMVSAVLSHALSLGGNNVKCEYKGNDVSIIDGPVCYNIDITSTAGIWHKLETRPLIAAISKYDLGNIIISTQPGRPAAAFANAIACSLAVEHPAFYGLPDPRDLPTDLKIQYHISVALNRMSQKCRAELAHMAYEATIHEAIIDMQDVDVYAQGTSYRAKADVLLTAIKNLEHDDHYAFPPLPCGQITGMYSTPVSVKVLDQDIIFPAMAFAAAEVGRVIRPENNETFLERFPASGRVPYADARDVASFLCDSFLPARGLTHKGPCANPDEEGAKASHWDTTSRIYASSAVAQYAEVRADLVRKLDSSPPGNREAWRSCVIYKGKVLCYYRVRDPVTDPRGYRVDWFALSSYEVYGSINVSTDKQYPVYLWPRQRIRSQEMELAAMLPRRLKMTLVSMIMCARTARASLEEICLAWQKLAMTAICSTWASGANFITCRHLSQSLSSPAPPFDTMAKKFKPPKTFACLLYLEALTHALEQWDQRDKYHDRCAILGLPRPYAQLEAYWQVWVPDELADTTKHFADCVLALYDEYRDARECEKARIEDLLSQMHLLSGSSIDYEDIRFSVRKSCEINTGGKFGWSVFGSMAAAYALSLEGSPKTFDRSFSRGGRARNLTSHLTVRHSGRIGPSGHAETGTVAEMILKQGVDDYLSTLEPACRFFYGRRPYFMNHPKNGEHKDREISITDPDSRIMLNDAEHICGEYGRTTRVDMLKRSDKDAHFYRLSSEAMLSGGVIQASDASRFAAMMSNVAVGITCYTLAALGGSTHLASAGAVYTRLASRHMVVDTCVLGEIAKRLVQPRGQKELLRLRKAKAWIENMKTIGDMDTRPLKSYTTASHTGQGMSHVGMSLEHGGALLMSITAAKNASIYVSGTAVTISATPLVTSDDSTIVARVETTDLPHHIGRPERQRACHMFLHMQRASRRICLRSISVMPNLAKEKVAGNAGEFNSQDNGIGVSCPILGFREMICQLTRPCAPSLVTDLLDAHAYGRTVALSGLGTGPATYAHGLMLDAVTQRWKIKAPELRALRETGLFPDVLLTSASPETIITPPASLMPSHLRESLMQMASDHHSAQEAPDINTRDLAFTVLGHVSIRMRKQHRAAIRTLKSRISVLEALDMPHQAKMLAESLTSTLSSARTRNIGRVAQRVRSKHVKPDDCLGYSFQKAPIFESTLTWLDFIASKIRDYPVTPEIKELAAVYGTRTVITRPTRARYPEPVTRKRSKPTRVRKPLYMLNSYGKTPFGKHVLDRSGATVISAIGPEQRREMARYTAARAYRHIPEHVLYGGKFLFSWNRRRAGNLTTEAPKLDLHSAGMAPGLWGAMCEESLAHLRDVEQRNMDTPVLALNYAGIEYAHYHGIYRGRDYSVTLPFDRSTATRFDVIPARARGGENVLCVLQGWTEERTWYGTGPTEQEIVAFQNSPNTIWPNTEVENCWRDIEKRALTHVPMSSCLIDHGDTRALYMIDPKLTRGGREHWRPYFRAKFLASVATGGYWYTAIKGVCVRAYLKGHCGSVNSWTGPVLGWRMSKTPSPVYGWEPPDKGNVRSLTMVGGVDSDSDLSVLNPQEFASGHCYVDRGGIHLVDEVHILEGRPEVLGMFLKINNGEWHFNASQGRAQLIDCALPAPVVEPSPLSVDACEAILWERTHMADAQLLDM